MRPIRHQLVSGAKKSKFNAKAVVIDGYRFDSQAEGRYYVNLKRRVKAGEVVTFLRQVPFHLPGNTRYVLDFLEFHADGTVHAIDVKGKETQQFRTKKRQVEEKYLIKIEVVK